MLLKRLCPVLCILVVQIPSYASANVAEKDLFPFGIDAGDSLVPPTDDTFAGPIQLQQPFQFFNVTQPSLFVDNNGAISFVSGVQQYTPTCGALPARLSMIAPFWADIHDAQGFGGQVFYRESHDTTLRSRASAEIESAFPEMWGTRISSLFIATWYQSPFFGASGCSYTNNTVPRNTFQLTLATDGIHSFALMYYTNITWTTGTYSGGNCSGLGGTPAKAGFDVGDGKTFYTIPASCTPDIIHIAETSNIGVPGKWIFRVDNAIISAFCDSEKYKTQKLQIDPPFITVFGQKTITVSGPCFNESYTAECVFHDNGNLVRVVATIEVRDQKPTAICLVPYLYTLGRIDIDLIIQFGDEKDNFSGSIYTTQWEADLSMNMTPISTDKVSLDLGWDGSIWPDNQTFELVFLQFDSVKNEWVEEGVFASNIPNTGSQTAIVVPTQKIQTFGSFILRVETDHHRSKRCTYCGRAYRLAIGTIFLFTFGDPSVESAKHELCNKFASNDPGVPDDLLPCPRTLDQAENDFRFESWWDIPPTVLGITYYMQRAPSSKGGAQMCGYQNGKLLMGPKLGGHPFRFSPYSPGNCYNHMTQDVVPYLACCLFSTYPDDCGKFYGKRPSDSGASYVAPRPGRANGDPHLSTFDGASYTFNGAGKFWLVKNTKAGDFEMQARMEQYVQPDGNPTSASVFTAIVMRENDVKVQIQLGSVNGIDVFIANSLVDLGSDQTQKTIPIDTTTISVSGDHSQVNVSFESGFSFSFTNVENTLTLWSTADRRNEGKTRGLMGVFDGNPDNDLQTPNGAVVPVSSPLQTIHYNFGLEWMIAEKESLFTYSLGKNYETYKNTDFKPNFQLPDVHNMSSDIVTMCMGEFECLYDYSTTNNRALANKTGQMIREFNESADSFQHDVEMCSPLKPPLNGYVTANNFFVNSTAKFACFSGYDLVGDVDITCMGNQKWSGNVPVCVQNASTTPKTSSGRMLEGCIVFILLVQLVSCFTATL